MATPIKNVRNCISSQMIFEGRIFCLFFLLVTHAYNGLSQSSADDFYWRRDSEARVIDSLKQIVNSTGRDTGRVKALLHLSDFAMASHPETGKEAAYDALTLSKELNYYEGQILSLRQLSFVSSITGQWAKGLDMAFQGVQMAREHKPEMELSFASIVGLAYQKQKNYKKILEWSLKPFHSKTISTAGRRIGDGEPGQGGGDMSFEIWSCAMMSSFGFMETGSIDSAFYYGNLSLEAAKKSLPPRMTGYSYGTLGYVYLKDNQFDSSIVCFHRAKKILQNAGETFAVHELNRDLAKVFAAVSEKDSVYKYATLAYDEANKNNNPLVIQDVAALLADYYEPFDKAKALQYLKISNVVRDSLSTIEKANEVYQLEWEQGRKAAEIEKARLANESKVRQNALLGSLTTVALIAAIVFYNNRQKQKANKVLASQKAELESTLTNLKAAQAQLVQSEKMASLGELTAGIAHEIQNPLNFVNNFSELNKELIEEMETEMNKGNVNEAKTIAQALKENQEKINNHGKRADSIVKAMLQHSRGGSHTKEATDINNLCDEYLRLSFHGFKAKDKSFSANFETSLDPSLPVLNVVPQDLGRVLLNLISNAFYAVSEKQKQQLAGYQPMVTVTTKKTGMHVAVSVRDNGDGIPDSLKEKIFQPFFTTKPTGQGTGLGLSLSYDIVKAYGGELRVETKQGEGTEFTILLPVQ